MQCYLVLGSGWIRGYAERDTRDAFTRVVYREAAAAVATANFYTPDARASA